MQQVLRFCNSRMFSLEGRIIIFKTLAISKIVYLGFLTVISNLLIKKLPKKKKKNFEKTFIWHSSCPKITHKTLYSKYENGGLKNVDISSKIIRLQCSWLRKLCDKNFLEWKIIPSHLINKLLIKFSKFYKNILFQWSSSLSAFSDLPSCIMSNFLWFNKHILIEKSPSFFVIFLTKA